MASYVSFADFYDGLTENVEYAKRCEYILDVFKKHNHKPELLLDLACGTGSLTVELAKNGIDVYGVDRNFFRNIGGYGNCAIYKCDYESG